MDERDRTDGQNTHRDDPDRDSSSTRKAAEDSTDMRKANENIRKSQGEDGGDPSATRPTIDRHR